MHRADDPNVKKKTGRAAISKHIHNFPPALNQVKMGSRNPLTIPLFSSCVVGDFLFWFCVATTLFSTLHALINTQNTTLKTSKNQQRKDLISHLKDFHLLAIREKRITVCFLKIMLIFCHL